MNKKPRFCIIEAPCKINLHLRIGPKRSDGFHSLESIFASLSLCDSLEFKIDGKDGDFGLDLMWENTLPGADTFAAGINAPAACEDIPMEKNLVFRTVSLFRESSGFKRGLKVRLVKRIPTGSGLGGGSSDAASTLLAMNALAESHTGRRLSMEEIAEMASQLGSDVPFFLSGPAALVRGRGELIEPVKTPQGLWVLIVKPPFSSDTAEAYRLLDEFREKGNAQNSCNWVKSEKIAAALDNNSDSWPFYNDFLPAFLSGGRNSAAYRDIFYNLKRFGASFVNLSGSGSSCYGIFLSKNTAEKAKKAFLTGENFVFLSFFIAQNAKPVLK